MGNTLHFQYIRLGELCGYPRAILGIELGVDCDDYIKERISNS